MNVAIVVMAHPARRQQAEKLAAEVDAPIVWDRGRGEWDTGTRAWHAAAQDQPDWAVVLQDDAQPIDDFRCHLADALNAAPGPCISLYVGTGRPRQPAVHRAIVAADHARHAWLEADSLLWGVATAVRACHVGPMLGWCDTHNQLPYDQRIGAYWRRQHRAVHYTWPALADHTDGPPLIERHRHEVPRRAHRTGAAATYQTGVTVIA